MDPTQRRIAWGMLLAIVAYFVVQSNRNPQPTAVPAPAQSANIGLCSLGINQAVYNADLGFVEVQVTGSAERMLVVWTGGQKEADTAQVCSAGICRMVVGGDRRNLKVQFDECNPIVLPDP